LLGKELADELKESPLAAMDVTLLDEGDVLGQITAVGDEAAVIQRLEDEALEGMEFAFFAGTAESVERHWARAREAGASLVDLTYALEEKLEMPVRSPWVSEMLGDGGLGLEVMGAVSAHPAAVMLALALARLQGKVPVERATVTVLEPASAHGREAMDELHQQTVSLLSFQSLPREQYDAQIAFNLLPSAGAEAKVRLAQGEGRILRHYQALSQGKLPELDLQLIHAPVFHGYSASMMLELGGDTTREEVVSALQGEHLEIAEETDPPTNVSAAGQAKVLVRVRPEAEGAQSRIWLWLAADNLKLMALNAIACALELRRLRPQGKVE
jgi:aspartate-semialdehyde dehydrogenase